MKYIHGNSWPKCDFPKPKKIPSSPTRKYFSQVKREDVFTELEEKYDDY